MNIRRDEQYERQQFGRHNLELRDELDRDLGRRGQDEWRSDAQRGAEDGWRGRMSGGYAGFDGGPGIEEVARSGFAGDRATRRYANEGLSSDFSLEGTHRFAREQRRANANHRGKGPKGFTRSDDRIRELVSEALSDHHDIDASDVEVTVKEGEVTLAGSIESRDVKRLAEDVVEGVAGVVDVHNRLVVAKPSR